MNTLTETLLREFETAPEPVQQEVLDFLLFVKVRYLTSASGIERSPGICGGDTCTAGTRIPVWSLEQGRRLGFTEDELLVNYPTLHRRDLTAAWSYVQSHLPEIEQAIHDNEQAEDHDVGALARRIDESIREVGALSGQLLRVNRPC